MNEKKMEDEEKEKCKKQTHDKAIDGDNDNSLINIFIDFIKDELLKSNIRYEIVKPILIYILYYLIPFVILLMFLNFITTIIAVYIVFKYLL
jgi:flagellar biosynthesis protein FlhB